MDIKSEFKSVLKEDKRLSAVIRLEGLPPSFRMLFAILARSGDSKFWWPALILLWLFGATFWRYWAVTAAIGIAMAVAAQWIIKHLVKRARPAGDWDRRARTRDPNSFPSGHATRLFLLVVLATALGPAWLAMLFWIWAPVASLARVVMGVHYLSDVIGGLLLGMVVGLLWLSVHEAVLQALLTVSLRTLHLALW